MKTMRAIKFKIVNEDRTSCVVHRDSKCSLHYPKDEIVHAIPGSIGISVFDTLFNAERFISPGYAKSQKMKILRVEPIGVGKRIKMIANIGFSCSEDFCTTMIENFLLKHGIPGISFSQSAPRGSIFYPAVKVLN